MKQNPTALFLAVGSFHYYSICRLSYAVRYRDSASEVVCEFLAIHRDAPYHLSEHYPIELFELSFLAHKVFDDLQPFVRMLQVNRLDLLVL